MLEVKLICIGKLKEKYWRDAVQEYAKRLSAFCRFQIIELNEARLPQDPNAAEIAKALGEESKAILAAAGRSALYTLCIEGKLVSSTQLAQQIDAAAVNGESSLAVSYTHLSIILPETIIVPDREGAFACSFSIVLSAFFGVEP